MIRTLIHNIQHLLAKVTAPSLKFPSPFGEGLGVRPWAGGESVFVLACVFASAFLVGCDRYEVELYYTGKADVRVNVDWETRFGTKPTGMTIMLAKDGDAITFTDQTNSVDGYDLHLEPGTYKMLIFNLSPGEFGSMRFFQMKSFAEAYAYAAQQQRTTDFWDVNVSYLRQPEPIGCVVDEFTVLPEMIDGDFHFVPWQDKIPNNYAALTLDEIINPMTTEMFIKVKIIGYKYMAGVIGNISGLADGFLLSQAWRREQVGYHLLDNWTMTPAPEESDENVSIGYITTRINTFGLPHGRELISQRDADHNVLTLCFTLIDGSQHVFRYQVGKDIVYKDAELRGFFSQGDVTLNLELVMEAPFFGDDEVPNLPYAQPNGTGAFDAEVSDWGDEETIDVPI